MVQLFQQWLAPDEKSKNPGVQSMGLDASAGVKYTPESQRSRLYYQRRDGPESESKQAKSKASFSHAL